MNLLKPLGLLLLLTAVGCSSSRQQQAQHSASAADRSLQATVDSSPSYQTADSGQSLRSSSRNATYGSPNAATDTLASLPGTSIGSMPAPSQPKLRLQRSCGYG